MSESEKILTKIKNSINNDAINEILNYMCNIKTDTLYLDYTYFKYFANNQTYESIVNYIINNINGILLSYDMFNVVVNMKGLTIGDVDKHKFFIQNIATVLKNSYPNKLTRCFIYNAPYVFSQVYNFVSLFIDKETQSKIELVSSSPK